MVCSQNTKQYNYSIPRFSYTTYDALGRITEVGELESGTEPTAQILNATSYPSNWSNYRFQVTRTHYDSEISSSISALFGSKGQQHLRNRVATSFYQEVYNASRTSYDHATHYSYDIHGNVETLIQDNPELAIRGGQYKKIDYKYDLISGKVNEVAYQKGEADAFYHKYSYDGDNRITAVQTSKEGKLWDNDASYTYYEHGPLARTEIGDLKVQGTDYAYTIQGWIKGVNNTTLRSDRDMGKDGETGAHATTAKDAFGYGLTYYSSDYQQIGSSAQFLATVSGTPLDAASEDLFNGNISKMVTAISPVGSGAAIAVQGRAFAYDQLNRLIEAKAFEGAAVVSSNSFATASNTGDYQEQFSYDANGNIESLTRKGHSKSGQNPNMDSFTYQYEKDVTGNKHRNRLLHVNDNTTYTAFYSDDIDDQGTFNQKIESSHNYDYDEIGNLVSDKQEKITSIEWNVYGKIKNIHKEDVDTITDITFKYDAQGNRISKRAFTFRPGQANNFPQTTYYVRDASGNVMSTYDIVYPAEAPVLVLKEHHIYGSQRLGIANEFIFAGDTVSPFCLRELGSKRYELSNHLGNVLNVVSDKKLGHVNGGSIDYYLADLISASDYYSFGSLMPGRTFSTSSKYRYGYQNQEKDDEIKGAGNSYEFKYRIHDPRLGRFLSIDPIGGKFPWNSPYAFA